MVKQDTKSLKSYTIKEAQTNTIKVENLKRGDDKEFTIV